MRPLAVLRPEPGATATCEAAIQVGLRPVAVPLFEIETVAWAAPESARFDGLLLTSANALSHAGPELEKLRGLPVYAVGKASAAQARSAGFAVSFVGGGGVDELLADIDPNLRLLHLCGEQLREPVAPRQSVAHLPVYRAAQLAAPDISAIAGAVVAVHSPRAGARLAELAAACRLEVSATAIAAISGEAARAAGGGWERTVTATKPSDAALLALAARLCNSSARQ